MTDATTERKDVHERKDAQEAANFEEIPAWAADLHRNVKDALKRIDEIDIRTKGGVPVERTAEAKDTSDGEAGGKKFAKAEAEETAGAPKEAPPAGPQGEKKDPELENGVVNLSTSGVREDERGHGDEKTEHRGVNDRMDAMYKQAATRIRELEGAMSRVLRQPTVDERNQIAAARHRADSVYTMLGRTTPEWMAGESPMAYRRRLADGLKDHSAALKKTVMDALPDDVFGITEERIYQDALEAAKQPSVMPPMVLRPHTYQDTTGHTVTEYYGDPMTWMAPFMSAGVKAKINRSAKSAS
jgi:hypothetical protein